MLSSPPFLSELGGSCFLGVLTERDSSEGSLSRAPTTNAVTHLDSEERKVKECKILGRKKKPVSLEFEVRKYLL